MREEPYTGMGATGESAGARLLALVRQAPGLSAVVVMALIGVGISVYLTFEHYTKGDLACPLGGGVVNCAKVTSSAFSVVPGTQLPITIPGLLWFLVSGGMAIFALSRLAQAIPEPPRLRLAHMVWGAAGLVFVLYLVYAELVVLHNICVWCTIIHIMTFLTFLIALSRLTQPESQSLAPVAQRRTGAHRPQATTRAAQRHAGTASQAAISLPARTQRARQTPPRSRRHR